jgi:hypothetical protein
MVHASLDSINHIDTDWMLTTQQVSGNVEDLENTVDEGAEQTLCHGSFLLLRDPPLLSCFRSLPDTARARGVDNHNFPHASYSSEDVQNWGGRVVPASTCTSLQSPAFVKQTTVCKSKHAKLHRLVDACFETFLTPGQRVPATVCVSTSAWIR